ncbi:hypothetical protein [Franzmannia qiaohouensis]|uniref:Uncharacterized protein n=1 Tax=Franzmannia qiaohouensis TaxID=1329370 RepID=A0ABU1HDI1_9GAMM|nr:hypothetical protein [Halomonas qiaohouensis]MDR5904894.1 hypothetical protein [Halomonas qiaohouensis]
MTLQDEKRRSLLGRLSRQLGYAAPALALVASGVAFQAVADDSATSAGFSGSQEAPLMLAEAHDAEADPEAEGGAEGEAEGEGEAEAEGEAEG